LLVAFLLSLGPRFEIAGWSPYQSLACLPGFAQARSIFRFGVFVQLSVVFLAAGGLQGLWQLGTNRFPNRRWRWCIHGLAIVLGTIGATELWPPAQRLFFVPGAQMHSWANWLKNNTAPDSVIVHLPFPKGKTVVDYEPTALAMYAQTIHQRRMANGYSAFFPKTYRQLRERLKGFPNSSSFSAIHDHGIDYCVVDLYQIPHYEIDARAQSPTATMTLVFTDPTERVGIYRVDARRKE